MDPSLLPSILATFFAAAVSVWVFMVLRRAVAEIVERVTGLSAVGAFFNRVLLIGLLFIAVGATLDHDLTVEADVPPLEYVWQVISALSGALTGQAVYLFGFLVLVTVLVSALVRRPHG